MNHILWLTVLFLFHLLSECNFISRAQYSVDFGDLWICRLIMLQAKLKILVNKVTPWTISRSSANTKKLNALSQVKSTTFSSFTTRPSRNCAIDISGQTNLQCWLLSFLYLLIVVWMSVMVCRVRLLAVWMSGQVISSMDVGSVALQPQVYGVVFLVFLKIRLILYRLRDS